MAILRRLYRGFVVVVVASSSEVVVDILGFLGEGGLGEEGGDSMVRGLGVR